MQIRELEIPDAYEITPLRHSDHRGVFFESYRADLLSEAAGHALILRQANTSISVRGAVRGIHYALVPPGQAKYVTVSAGTALDFIVDLRVGSPTFRAWASVTLDDVDGRAVYLAEGLGHCVVALTERVMVNYLVSEAYDPSREFAINPFDPVIGLEFPSDIGPFIVSPKDLAGKAVVEAQLQGLLPNWDDCRSFYRDLNEKG